MPMPPQEARMRAESTRFCMRHDAVRMLARSLCRPLRLDLSLATVVAAASAALGNFQTAWSIVSAQDTDRSVLKRERDLKEKNKIEPVQRTARLTYLLRHRLLRSSATAGRRSLSTLPPSPRQTAGSSHPHKPQPTEPRAGLRDVS
ncbi:hypothetical protein ABZP36_032562 [Zizania latifolia]